MSTTDNIPEPIGKQPITSLDPTTVSIIDSGPISITPSLEDGVSIVSENFNIPRNYTQDSEADQPSDCHECCVDCGSCFGFCDAFTCRQGRGPSSGGIGATTAAMLISAFTCGWICG